MSKAETEFNGLTIDLSALASNWHYLNKQLTAGAECSAVVKANAYGLGVNPLVQRLVKEGCKHFFVTGVEEALEIKPFVPEACSILVLSGCRAGEELSFLQNGFIPVLISLPMFERWLEAKKQNASFRARCAVKVNTGMNRLGMEPEQWLKILQDYSAVELEDVQWFMSHLACADVPGHPQNHMQLNRFRSLVEKTAQALPGCKYSLANSAGIFLGEDFHFDLVRPGIALYGGQPQNIKREIKPVVQLKLEVLQAREGKKGESVGYGASYTLEEDKALLAVAGGYADGLSRALGNKMEAVFEGLRFPQLGRVSMDSLIFDVTALPEDKRPHEGDVIEVLGANLSAEELADKASTINYEILTSLGQRFPRLYLD